MEGLGIRAKEVQPLFISIDSDRDTPEVLAEFISAFGTDIIGLTGTSEQIAKTARSFFIYYKKAGQGNTSDSYMMSHSSQLFLFNRQGYYVKAYPYGTLAEDILADLQDKIS